MVTGAYGVMVVHLDEKIVIATQSSSPLMVGTSGPNSYISSHIQAFPHGAKVSPVEAGQYVLIKDGVCRVKEFESG